MKRRLLAGLCLALVLLSQAECDPNTAGVALTTATAVNLPHTIAQTPVVYYVSLAGNDSNAGTSARPWRTIQKAANTMTAGDTVIVAAGRYPEHVQVTRSGQSGAAITYQAEGTVVMSGFTVRANHITIRGFEITDTPSSWTDGNGVFVEGSYCLIENNDIYLAAHYGITLNATASNPAVTSDCVVRHNRLYNSFDCGIDVRGRNHLIEGNEVWGGVTEGTPRTGDSDGIHFFGSGHIIRKNYIHNIHDGVAASAYAHTDCFQTWEDSYHEVANNIIIEQNRCDNIYAQTLRANGQGLMIESGAGHLVIRNNIIQAYKGVNVNGGNNLAIVNNIFASDVLSTTAYYPVGVTLVESPNTTIKNNIFYDLPGTIIGIGDSASRLGLDVGYNLSYRSDGRRLWGSPYLHDLWAVNPLFVDPTEDDFHLQSQSPAIDAGESLPNVTDDVEGTPRPQGGGFDIGAYEVIAHRIFLSIVHSRLQRLK